MEAVQNTQNFFYLAKSTDQAIINKQLSGLKGAKVYVTDTNPMETYMIDSDNTLFPFITQTNIPSGGNIVWSLAQW